MQLSPLNYSCDGMWYEHLLPREVTLHKHIFNRLLDSALGEHLNRQIYTRNGVVIDS